MFAKKKKKSIHKDDFSIFSLWLCVGVPTGISNSRDVFGILHQNYPKVSDSIDNVKKYFNKIRKFIRRFFFSPVPLSFFFFLLHVFTFLSLPLFFFYNESSFPSPLVPSQYTFFLLPLEYFMR